MGFVIFKAHYDVVCNGEEKLQDRQWAFRSCCYSLCGLLVVLDTDDVVKAFAKRLHADTKVVRLCHAAKRRSVMRRG